MSEMMDENFIDLLDEYLCSEELEMKKIEDQEKIVKEIKNNHTESPFTEDDYISIDRYVNDCLGIKMNCSHLYHCGLKDIGTPYVMGVSNDFANKNPELVKQGYLLLVKDARHNRGTYINPIYLDRILKKEEAEKELKVLSHQRDVDLQKLDMFYRQYQEQKLLVEKNEEFYNVLKETHKVKQVKQFIKTMKGKIKNEEY